MCGILMYKGKEKHDENLKTLSDMQRHRGPDNTSHLRINDNIFMSFHRLSINDQTSNGNQPFHLGNLSLICNGEIYNYKELISTYNLQISNEASDCTVILHLYNLFCGDMDKLLSVLDGVYSFVIVNNDNSDIIAARDSFGVRPMYLGHNGNHREFMLSSEMKPQQFMKYVSQFLPGHWLSIPGNSTETIFTYNTSSFSLTSETIKSFDIYKMLNESVVKRLNTSHKIGCLLSGGLDSSIIAHLLSRNMHDNERLNTFSIGQTIDAPDLVAARAVASAINSNHHEIIISAEDMFSCIPDVIKAIESYDTTTIRASTPMYLLCKSIRSMYPDMKVLFSGEGSDEIFGGYMYFHKAPNMESFQKESKKLIDNIHYFDGLRADRCITSFGFELYVPFLDRNFVQMVYNIPPWYRKHPIIEKWCLRKAFSGTLPDSIIWRQKEAFSDGISVHGNSWHTYIKNNISVDEKQYYYEIYNMYFNNRTHVLPGYWMPNWSNTTDPSARELN